MIHFHVRWSLEFPVSHHIHSTINPNNCLTLQQVGYLLFSSSSGRCARSFDQGSGRKRPRRCGAEGDVPEEEVRRNTGQFWIFSSKHGRKANSTLSYREILEYFHSSDGNIFGPCEVPPTLSLRLMRCGRRPHRRLGSVGINTPALHKTVCSFVWA